MLHYAQGLAASPPVLYKFMVGRRAALPFLFFGSLLRLFELCVLALARHRNAPLSLHCGAGPDSCPAVRTMLLTLARSFRRSDEITYLVGKASANITPSRANQPSPDFPSPAHRRASTQHIKCLLFPGML